MRWDRVWRTYNYRVGAEGSYDLVYNSFVAAPGEILTSAEVGIRVRRGPDWKWHNQDGGGAGITIDGVERDGWVRVCWDTGMEQRYRVGAQGSYDLIIDFSYPPAHGQVLRIPEPGIRVRRGPDWKWQNQDGGGLGTTQPCSMAGWVCVWWDHEPVCHHMYRVGAEGKYDLTVAEPRSTDYMVGRRVRFIQGSEHVDFSGCPGSALSFGAGWTQYIHRIEGEWFTTQQFATLWAPLSAVQLTESEDSNYVGYSEEEMEEGVTSFMDSEGDSIECANHPGIGHDEEWLDVEEASSMQCPICLYVARDALAHDCGHLFCESCWDRWITDHRNCPVCREDGHSIVRAPRDQRKILNLKIRCPLDCGETIRLGDKEAHVTFCATYRRCSACGEEMLAEMLTIHEKEMCRCRPIPCELCSEMVRMDQMEAHMAGNVGIHMLALHKENQALKKENQTIKKESRSLKKEGQFLKARVEELERQVVARDESDA